MKRADLRAVAGLAAALGCLSVLPAWAQAPAPARVLVIPFEVKREASIFWLGEASAVLLSDDLAALGRPVITREERRHAFERLHLPAASVLTDATVIRVAQLVGASEVVMGSLQLENDALVVRARGIALDTGRIAHDVTDKGPMGEMFSTFGRVAAQIARAAPMPVDRLQPLPLAAFENFIKGLLAETPPTAIKYLETTLAAAPGFDRARLSLWEIYTDQGDHALALAAVSSVPVSSSWSRRARFLAGLSYISLKRLDEAFTTFNALVDAGPTAAAALNNLGVVQVRRLATGQSGQAAYYFDQAVKVDPDDSDYAFNLGYAYALGRDPQAAIYWLREAVRRNPADGDAHFMLGFELASAGSIPEAQRERELARRLSSAYEQLEKRPSADGLPKGLERIKDGIDLPHARQIEAALVISERRDQRELAHFYLDRGRRQFEHENDHQALDELNRAVYLSPYEAEAHLLIGRIHVRNGRLPEAIDAFKISIWSSETVQAHVALGEAYLQARDTEAARSEAERALGLDPASADAQRLLGRIRAQ